MLLGIVLVVRLGTDRIRPIDVVLAGLVALVGYAAVLHRNAVSMRANLEPRARHLAVSKRPKQLEHFSL